jgi:Fe-S-cluster containining protein
LDQIARYLHLSHHQFAAAYLIPNTEASRAARYTGLSLPLLAKLQRRDLLLLYRQPDGGFHLRSRENPTRDCIFLQADGCQIHAVKPEQCASFPMKWRNPDSFETCAGLRALSGLADASSMNSHPTKQDAAQS